jgi:hypothetical protein
VLNDLNVALVTRSTAKLRRAPEADVHKPLINV